MIYSIFRYKKQLAWALLPILFFLRLQASAGETGSVFTSPNPGNFFHTTGNTGIPVLPQPQQVQVFDIATLPATLVADPSIPAATWQRLKDHWTKTRPAVAGAAGTLRLQLLGNGNVPGTNLNGAQLQHIGTEGYALVVRKGERLLVANTEAGLFYGLQTLKQLLRAGWKKEIVIVDWPVFPVRAIYDDISRGPISTVAYIKKQIERIAELKLNCLSFYIEHVVQTASHPDFAPADGKLTIADIRELAAYAKTFHVQLAGSFQSFGHFEKILALPQYASLGATPNLISPLDPRARQFLADVIGELCDAFDSPWFNVNCDETFDLGQGTTKPYVDSFGKVKLYAEQLRFLYDVVKKHGKQMMMWGDFAVDHPEVLDLLPKDIIYLTWEYGDQASFAKWIDPFAGRGLQFMVCPGILNSYRMFPDMTMARANIAHFAAAGEKAGASGVLTTIWDDGGTYLFSGDWYGVYVAAEKSWNTSGSDDDFDQRFEMAAYGTHNGAYVSALNNLMGLRRLALTYDLNDRLWQQQLLPDAGSRMILNNTGLGEANTLLHLAAPAAARTAAKLHPEDGATLRFAIAQYQLMLDTRNEIAQLAEQFDVNKNNSRWRLAATARVKKLAQRYRQLRATFGAEWLRENQRYWLDVTLEPFDKKINDLDGLAVALAGSGKDRDAMRLNILVSTDFYFQNWMLVGAFPMKQDQLPAFLYGETEAYNKAPKPGDMTQYQGKMYRWRKYASDNGGIIDARDYYTDVNNATAVYAYCSINTDEPAVVTAYLGLTGAAELYCNGERVMQLDGDGAAKAGETAWTLSLKKGVNAILLKYRLLPGQDNSFTFRLDPSQRVTNHKHKYQLNAKTETHDAE